MAARPYKKPRRPTPESLDGGALYYLERYAASEASLRRVLRGKIARYAMADPAFAADAPARAALEEAAETVIAKYKKLGAINDTAYAEMKVGSMRRAGKSARLIAQSLAQKGVKSDEVARALETHDSEQGQEAEKKAALALAKKRGLGPFRRNRAAAGEIEDPKVRAKAIAAFARAGFSFSIAKDILGYGPEDIDDL